MIMCMSYHLQLLVAKVKRNGHKNVSLIQEGYGALHYATKNGYNEIVDVLLQHEAEPDLFDEVRKCS